MNQSGRYNKNLLLVISALGLVIVARLAVAAMESGNWRGFGYSSIHLLIVAIGSYLAIRQRQTGADPKT